MSCNSQLPTTLIELVQQKVSALGESTLYTYLTDDQETSYALTYAELDRQARCIAAQLQNLNARGERALLLFPSNLDFLCGFFGALYAGVIAVPAYPPRKNQNIDRLRAIIQDSHAKYVLASSQVMRIAQPMLQELSEFAGVTFIATDQLPIELAQDWIPEALTPSTVAFLQYTSGSTGDPKGVMLTHGNLLYNQEMIRVGIANNVSGNYVSWLPLFHDMGLGAALQVIYRGAAGCLMAPATFIQRPQRWLWAISDFQAALSGGPNFAYDLCIKTFTPELYEGLDLSHWRVAFNGAEPVKASTLEAFSKLFAPYGFRAQAFQPCYGLAEATVGVTGGEGGATIKKTISLAALQNHQVCEITGDSEDSKIVVACGHAWLQDELLIVNPETCQHVGANEVGEIWLNSPSVGLGYWRREALSEGVFRAHLINGAQPSPKAYLRTGDLGFVAEGQLYVTGRIKELLIIRGRNYYPTDIEHCVMACDPALSPQGIAAFTVEQDNVDHLVLVCEIERKYLRIFDAEILRQKICQAVAEQFELRVESVVFVKPGHMPKTSSGKIQRGLCSIRYTQGSFDAVASWASTVLSAMLPSTAVSEQIESTAVRVNTESLSRSALNQEGELEKIKQWLMTWFSRQLELPEAMIDPAKNLASLGVDSLLVMRTSGELSHLLGCELPVDLLWEYPTINQLSAVLLDQRTLHLSPVEPWLDARCTGETLYPASSAQKRHWLMHQFAHFKTAYNLTAAYRIRGDLNVGALSGAIQRALAHHSVLRTVFFLKKDTLWQRILPMTDNDVLVVDDLSTLADDERERRLCALIKAESAYIFDLQHDALFRSHLWRLAAQDYVLQLNLHHSVADGWSVERLLGELSRNYAAIAAGKENTLPDTMPLQFVDYLRWQQDNQSPEKLQQQLDYWTKKLASAPVLELRTDYPRPALPSGEGAHCRFVIPEKLERALRELCAREEATLYHLLLAALSLLLSRYSRQDVICIGSPAANRPHRSLADVAGIFVNTLVMRNNLSGNPSFTDLLRRVKKTAQEAYNHQDLPFDQLVSALALGGDMRYSPLFQVMLVVQPFALEEALSLKGLAVEPLLVENNTSKFDLGFEFCRLGERLQMVVEYRTDLFRARTIERMAGHFIELLEQIVEIPQAPIDTISMVPASQRQHLLRLANTEDFSAGSTQTLVDLFEEQVAQRGEAVALVYEHASLTYRQLNQTANQLAHLLREHGVQAGDLVGLSLERSLDLVWAIVAILKVGAAYVPVDPQSPLRRTEIIFEDAHIKILIGQSELKANLPTTVPCLFIDELKLEAYPTDNLQCPLTPEMAAYVIYTSGTTGQPKGVVVSHRNVVRLFNKTAQWFHFDAKDVWTLFHSYGFDFSVWEMWGALLYGGRLVIVPHWVTRSPTEFAALLQREQVTVLNQTAAAFYPLQDAVLAAGLAQSMALRYVIFGGDALELRRIEPWRDAFGLERPQLINMYGITETTVHVTYHRLREVDFSQAVAPIGRPIPDNTLYLLDKAGNLCPLGVPGEMYVGGAGVTKGYLNKPDLNRERFVPNPFSTSKGSRLYRSGDLAYYDHEDNLCYQGRIDQQVKIRGYRIELGDIENCLNTYQPDTVFASDSDLRIKTCAVLAQKDRHEEKQLLAYIVPSVAVETLPDVQAFIKAVRAHVSHTLPSYMAPGRYILLDKLPLTINGKLDTKKLHELSQQSVITPEAALPNTQTEKYLAVLWQDKLGLAQVGIDDNFFELGGHSLMAAQILNQVREIFDMDIPTVELFQRPTVRHLARYIDTVLAIKTRAEQNENDNEGDRQEFEL